MKTTIFGAGCFWGVEKLFKELEGVINTDVGYCGGHTENPTYREVCQGKSGHIEVVRIHYNPELTTFQNLLKYFFKLHDPTQANGQGPDIGTQYLSAIFVNNTNEQKEAIEFIDQIEKRNIFKAPITTKILLLNKYWPAEDYHQDYLTKNPTGHMCHIIRPIDFDI